MNNQYTDTNPGLTRIKQHYPMMSAQEKRVADYIMKNCNNIINHPVARIAEDADVSTATVVRFCHSIGFSGMAEFKNYLRREFLSPNGPWTAFRPDDTIQQIMVKTSDYNKRAMDETLVVLSEDAVEAAVDAIDKAGRVLIVTEGASGCSARCAYDAFLQIGIRCSIVMDPFFQVTEVSQTGPGDVVLGVCHSGRARNSVDGVRLGKEAGATTISIAGIVGSPITKCSDIVLYTGLADHRFYSETMAVRICELNVISVLHTALSIRNSEKLGDFRKRNSKLFELKRYKK